MLAICGILYAWATRLPGVQPEVVAVPTVSSLRTSLEELGALYFTLSLALSPLLPMAMGRLWRRLSLPSIVLGLVVLALGAWLFSKGAVLAGNYLTQQGATGSAVLNGARPDLFPEPVWRSLEVIAIAAGVALALVVGTISHVVLRTILHGGAEGLVASFAVLNSAVLTVYGVFVRASVFDRYLWALTFASAVVVVANCLRVPESLALGTWHHRARTVTVWLIAAASVTVVAILVLVTAAVTVNADAYDGARWRAGELAVKAGVRPSQVDAGFEWVGDHADEDAISTRYVAAAPLYETWYDQMFPGFQECAFVSGSPWSGPTLKLLRAATYNELGVAVRERLDIYVVISPGCGDEPVARSGR